MSIALLDVFPQAVSGQMHPFEYQFGAFLALPLDANRSHRAEAARALRVQPASAMCADALPIRSTSAVDPACVCCPRPLSAASSMSP